jgi:membrane protease YdiL (CAAX protease family)
MPRFLRYLLVGLAVLLATTGTAQAERTGLACIGAMLGEYLLPGVGYALLGEYDKAVIFGGLRWAALSKYASFARSPNYLKDPKDIYKTEQITVDGKELQKMDIYLSRETFYGKAYASMYGNLTFATIYDLYDGCGSKSETYKLMAAPFRIDHFWAEPTFWAPVVYAGVVPLGSDNVTYHVDTNLSRQAMINLSFVQYQLVGIGEEMLFRGVIQRSLYNGFSGFLSKKAARWTSLVTASAIFGAAHSGQGFSANSGVAFGAGMYLGWVYNPEVGQFDLIEPIAIHAWWDTILVNRRLRESQFVARKSGETARNPLAARTYPLFGFTYRF